MVSGDNSPFVDQLGDLESPWIADSESVVIAGTGHMIHFEAPDSLAGQIEQFLKKTL
jgi:pimeloyl-ACP methyl ester carboxylesterase